MKSKDMMTSPVHTLHADDTLADAAKAMWDHDCGSIPVTGDGGALLGIITDRDVLMSTWSQGRPLGELCIWEAMARHVFTVRADDDLRLVEKLMRQHQVRRVPVVDDERRPIGMITVGDLAREAQRVDTGIQDGLLRAADTLAAVCEARVPPA